MSVNVNKRVYSNLFTKPNEAVVPDWLIGNTGDWITANFDLEVGIDFIGSMEKPLAINYEQRTIKLMNGKKWGDYGFDIGTTIKMTYTRIPIPTGLPSTELFDVVVENIMGDVLVYEENPGIQGIGYELIPMERSTEKIVGVKLYDDRELQGVKIKYTHIENSEVSTTSLASFIDGTATEIMLKGLDSISDESFHDMELTGLQSGMSIHSARIRKVLSSYDLEEDWTIPFSGIKNMQIPTGWTVRSQSIALNYIGTPTGVFKNSSSSYFGFNGTAPQMFIKNADFSEIRNLHLRLGTIIINDTGGGLLKRLRLFLTRFTGGIAYNFAENFPLKDYFISAETVGRQLNYEDIISVNIQAGDSYALTMVYEIAQPSLYSVPSINFINNYGYAKLVNVVNDDTYKTKFQLELKFMLSSVFEDREELINRIAPSVIFNANSLTDIIDISFYPEWNNPNIIVKNNLKETERLGNTGWFNENYNGLANDFIVKSFSYENLAGQIQQEASYTVDTKVRVKISNVQNLVPNETNVHLGFIWVPIDEESYKNKTTGFHKNTKVSSPAETSFYLGNTYPYTYEGFSDDNAKMNIKDIVVTNEGDDLYVIFTLNPNSDFATFFEGKEDDRLYALWLSVGDSTLDVNLSDRVNLLLDVNTMTDNIVITGELEDIVNNFIEHPKGHEEPGVDYYDGFLEDDVLSVTNFQINKGEILNSVSFGYEVENLTTGATYILEKLSYNTSGFPIINDVQEIDLNQERGFLLPINNNKNWVKIIRNNGADTETKAGYTSYFGSKIRWEQWLERTNVLPEFFDITKENNGFNNNWLDYLRNGTNHRIAFFMYFDIEIDGVLQRLKNSFNINFLGYDESEIITTEHNYFNNETNESLNIGTDDETGRPLGVLLANKKTRIEIIYTNTVENFEIGNVYATTTCEVYRGAGEMQHHQISSIWEHTQGGLLIPVDGMNKLKVEQIASNKIKTTCLVDNTVLEMASKYKITGRIGCYPNDNGIPLESRIYDQNNYEPNYE